MSNSLLWGPVDSFTLQSALGDDSSAYLLDYQGAYVACAGAAIYLGGHAIQTLWTTLRYPDVRMGHRLALVVLGLLAWLKVAAELAGIYTIAVLRFGRFSAFWLSCVTALSALLALTLNSIPQLVAGTACYLIALIVQLIFVDLLFHLYSRSWTIASALTSLAVVGFVFGMLTITELSASVSDGGFSDTRIEYRWRYVPSLCFPVLIDMSITGLWLWRLSRIDNESDDEGVGRIVNRLVRVTLQTNALTALFVIVAMALGAVHSPIAPGFFLPVGPLYILSLCVNLRSRRDVRRELKKQRRARRRGAQEDAAANNDDDEKDGCQ